MTKDDRLYGKFTLEFPRHRKIAFLSDAAYRCLHEAILYSREEQTDGLLARRYALARWSLEVLTELCNNDDENPSLSACDKGWYIHDFDQHQDTKADIECRRQRNKAAGQKGGLAKGKRAAKQPAKRDASEVLSENLAEKEEHKQKGGYNNVKLDLSSQELLSRKSGTSPGPADRMGRPSMSITRLAGNDEPPAPDAPPADLAAAGVAASPVADLVRECVTSSRWSSPALTDLRLQVSELQQNGCHDNVLRAMLRLWDKEPAGGRRQLRLFEVDAVRELSPSNGRVATADRLFMETQAMKLKYGGTPKTPQELFGEIAQITARHNGHQ